MRTTVEIDDELLAALKELAQRQNVTLGQIISDLTRRSLPAEDSQIRNGVRIFASKPSGMRPDLQLVNTLRD